MENEGAKRWGGVRGVPGTEKPLKISVKTEKPLKILAKTEKPHKNSPKTAERFKYAKFLPNPTLLRVSREQTTDGKTGKRTDDRRTDRLEGSFEGQISKMNS